MPKLHHLKQKPIGKSKLIKEEKKFCSTHIVDIKKKSLPRISSRFDTPFERTGKPG